MNYKELVDKAFESGKGEHFLETRTIYALLAIADRLDALKDSIDKLKEKNIII